MSAGRGGRLSFRGAAAEEGGGGTSSSSSPVPTAAVAAISSTSSTTARSSPAAWTTISSSSKDASAAAASGAGAWWQRLPYPALTSTTTDDKDDRPSSLPAALPAPLHYWWARLERAAGGPRRLRSLLLAFMVLKSLFGLSLLVLALRSSSGSTSINSAGATPDGDNNDTDTPLPYRLAGNGAKATGLAIGVISGSGPAQQRRVRLLQETWATSLDPRTDGLLVFSDATDAGVPSVGVDGTGSTWQGAQDRFFPALAFLHRAFPNAAWYLLVDDDTFLVPRNLKAALRRRGDPEGRWYVGRTMFVEADGGKGKGKRKGKVVDGVDAGEDGKGGTEGRTNATPASSSGNSGSSDKLISFAHGGSGIGLSRGLMAAFAPILEKELASAPSSSSPSSSSSCRGTGYGDGDLALCLRTTLGVKVTHEPCLFSTPPWGAAQQAMTDAVLPLLLGGDAGADKAAAPCSFHQALRRPGDESPGAGRADLGEDEQVRAWHREYNMGEAGGD